jgi:hypothetical protein
MTYDPAWDMPKVNWQQQGSFEQGELALAYAPGDAPLVCIPPINRYWLPFILGCLDQLINPSTWIVADDTALNAILDKAIALKQLVGQAGDCVSCPLIRLQDCVLQSSCDGGTTWTDVSGWADNFGPCVQSAAIITTPPANPGGRTTDQMACSIASYLTDQIITVAIQQAVDNFNNNRNLLQLGVDLALIIPEFQLVGLFATAVSEFYGFYSSITISYFETALTDPTLFSDIRCAVYNAIAADGHLTLANFTTVLSNVCGISYVHSDVIDAICAFLTTMGFPYTNQLSQGAGLNPYDDCSDCGGTPTWCYQWDFNVSPGPWVQYVYGVWTPGVGWVSSANSGQEGVAIDFVLPTATFLTNADVSYTTSSVNGAAGRQYLAYLGGTNIGTQLIDGGTYLTPHQSAWVSMNLTIDRMIIRVSVPSTSDTCTIRWVRFYGTGLNPFGDNNCRDY